MLSGCIYLAPTPEEYLQSTYGQYVYKVEGPLGGSGTGFQIVAPSGRLYIATNKHVCDMDIGEGYVVIRARKHRIVARSKHHDLCLLTPRRELHDGLRVSEAPPRINQQLYTIGHPAGMPLQTHGGRLLAELVGAKYGLDFPNYLFSIWGAPGSSGSPVINERGQVCAVIAWMYRDSGQMGGVTGEQLRGFLARF